jgi:hypothetical protein
VTVTVSGPEYPQELVRQGVEKLSELEPFLVSSRYGSDRAEFCYWDEADDIEVIVVQAKRLWSEYVAVAAGLAGWQIQGLEVSGQQEIRRSWHRGDRPAVRALGEILPLKS